MKRLASARVVAVVVAVGIGSAALLARQEGRPGLPSIARMFILNKDRSEAIPVTLQGGDVQSVMVVGATTVALAPNSTVLSRTGRQSWEYQQLALKAGADVAPALNAAGQEGWEAVGVVSVPGSSVPAAILMKRPR